MKLHKTCHPFFVYEFKCVYTKTFHHGITAGQGAVAHDPKNLVHAFRRQGNKIPEIIMRSRCLWHFVVGLRFDGMYQVGELNGILNKKHRDVVPNQVVVPFLRVKLDGKSSDVAGQICRAARTSYR